ncbi:MAG: DUF6600 domain-containing protein [Syntrophobacteraceae bacterium]
MKRNRVLSCLAGALLALVTSSSLLNAAEDASATPRDPQPLALVGRIAHVEGLLTRYVPESKEWVATVQDTPFALEDSLYTDAKGRAEIILPNNTWARIGGQTQLQLLAIEDDYAELDLALGIGRFFNKGAKTELKVTTPYGYVLAPHDTVFELMVGDKSVEVTALQGTVDFVHVSNESRFEVIAKSSCLLADAEKVTSTQGRVDAVWDKWNCDRDLLWAKRMERCHESAKVLPEALCSEAYALEEHGRWESVSHEGATRTLWRPTRVAAGWTPFTVGRWTVWHDEHCWVPAEPFGYVTHHYGNWVWVGSHWYWAPPVVGVNVHVGGSFFSIGLGWYPGRVAWVHSPVHHRVGWITLAPDEVFYSHRYWGPASVVAATVGPSVFVSDVARYRYHGRAVVVRDSNFYRVNSYAGVRIRGANVTVGAAGFRASPVVGAGFVSNAGHSRYRYHYRAGSGGARLSQRFSSRAQFRSVAAGRQVQRIRGAEARQRVAGFSRGSLVEGAAIERPRMRSRGLQARSVGRGGASRERSDFQQGGRDRSALRAGGGRRGNDVAFARGPGGNGGARQGGVPRQGRTSHAGNGGRGRGHR